MPTLPFTMIPQKPHMNWCWAAVTASLRAADGGPGLQMCDVVTRISGLACCGPTPPACEQLQSDLAGPMSVFGLLRVPPLGVLPFNAGGTGPSVMSEIAAGRAIAFGLRLGLLSHFGVIVGFDPSGFVVACDPFFLPEPSAMPYATLLGAYQPGARWVRSYLTT